MFAIDFGAEGIVVVAGRLDAAQSPAAQSFLDRVQGVVTLDCNRLEYLSSAGLGVLLKTHKRLLASASCGSRASIATCRTYSSIPGWTRSSKSSPPNKPCTNFFDRCA